MSQLSDAIRMSLLSTRKEVHTLFWFWSAIGHFEHVLKSNFTVNGRMEERRDV